MNCLKVVVFLLLAGHGWLNLIGKKGLLTQYASLGFANPVQTAYVAGIFEIIGACLILIKPLRSVLIVFTGVESRHRTFLPALGSI